MKSILFRNINQVDSELFEKVIQITGCKVATTAIKDGLSQWLKTRESLNKAYRRITELEKEKRNLQEKLATRDTRSKNLKAALNEFLKDDC